VPGPRVTVVGSANVDLVARVAALPAPGATITSSSFRRVPGGKGANQAVALARLGVPTTFVGAVGDDADGLALVAGLRAEGIDTSAVRVVAGPTGMALIVVDDAADTTIVVVPGANALLAPSDVARCDGDAVLCQLEVADEVLAEAARQATGWFAFNPAPARPVDRAVVDRADLVVANEQEHAAIAGLDRARLIAVTSGAAGARLLRDGREVARATPPSVRAVDGTAAGDAFCAALLAGLLEGRSDATALARACAAGALAATRHGAQPSLPTRLELDRLMEET
jgi:ribokinase